jgi:DNA polymerase III epsilon subunit-like protein
MRVLVFDTETTGLFPRKNDFANYPYIVQLSWIVYDFGDNKIKSVNDYIIKLKKGQTIPQESINVHGITNKIMREKGTALKPVLYKFVEDLKSCTTLIAHNIRFDKKVMNVELMRNGFSKSIRGMRKKEYCTMREGTDICNLTMTNYYTKKQVPKFPRLTQLHDHFFGSSPKNIHNALIDILLCFRCYYKLTQDFDIMNVNPEFKRVYNNVCKL